MPHEYSCDARNHDMRCADVNGAAHEYSCAAMLQVFCACHAKPEPMFGLVSKGVCRWRGLRAIWKLTS